MLDGALEEQYQYIYLNARRDDYRNRMIGSMEAMGEVSLTFKAISKIGRTPRFCPRVLTELKPTWMIMSSPLAVAIQRPPARLLKLGHLSFRLALILIAAI